MSKAHCSQRTLPRLFLDLLLRTGKMHRMLRRCFHSKCVDISPVVREALEVGQPVVALESTIITHGMPYPTNLQTARQVEETVRSQGAVPATVAIIKGRVKVGVDGDMLCELAALNTPAVKTSRRDFPYVLSKGLNGGTTVSGTVMVANLVGIKVFATGGIGGVHRGGENSLDVSADLTELGRNPIAVVSSGVKSILDIARTLEYLETQGVCVATYGSSKEFPAFYSPCSGVQAPYNVTSPAEAAGLLHSLIQLDMKSGLLLAVPIPDEFSLAGSEIEQAIQEAVREAENQGISGKEVTPFLLRWVNELTEGKSLAANIALVKNNAKIAAQVAVEFHRLNTSRSRATPSSCNHTPVVIGGCNVDCVMAVKDEAIKADGRTHHGEVRQSGGGVGRNLADALAKLQTTPLLISAVGRDQFGAYLLETSLNHVDVGGVSVLDDARTACYSPIVDKTGECYFGIGDMDIHDRITPHMVKKFSSSIEQSPLVILDGNIPEATIQFTLQLCKQAGVPVWFEPTDLKKAAKPFHSDLWKTLSFISPNFNELRRMAKAAGVCSSVTDTPLNQLEPDKAVTQATTLARGLAEHINTVLVTMGRLGVLIVSRRAATHPIFREGKLATPSAEVSARLYGVTKVENLVNVSGAGDCFAAGFIKAMLCGLPESRCAAVGLACATLTLHTSEAVPVRLLGPHSPAWNQEAHYRQLL